MHREMDLTPVAQAYGCKRRLLYVTLYDLFGCDDFSGMDILDVGAGRA